MKDQHYYDETKWRVWPDGTIQDCSEREPPYSHMSDDYVELWAYSEDEARLKAFQAGFLP